MTDDRVVRLDTDGRVTGTVGKEEAHRTPLIPHLAFSVFVFDLRGQLLLQRRSAEKTTFAGLWSNSCCSHPRPDEPLLASARRRVREELGVTVDAFELKGGFWYRALDETGNGEHEYDLVLTCRIDPHDLDPDPHEVDEVVWVEPTAARSYSEGAPAPGLTPWLMPALEIACGPVQDVAVDVLL